MTSQQQRVELHRRIWAIADNVRGAVDGWDFKQYVLGTLFYRFISEHFCDYVNKDGIDYASLRDDDPRLEAAKTTIIKEKGYFLYPSELFENVANNAHSNADLNIQLSNIFRNIESSAQGFDSEDDIKGLFADFDATSNRLGNTVADKNRRLAAVLKGVAALDFGDFTHNEIDVFGDAYEFLISKYAANAGKSGGEFFTPQYVSKLVAKIALHGQSTVNKIYDPACGSGALLLQAKKQFEAHQVQEGFFGQEINHTTYNLARMNMFLHNIGYSKFNIELGDTLLNPKLADAKPFDAIVSNPPYSIKWVGSDDPTLINDERFAPAGVLAPKSNADFAFILHALNYLSPKGRAAIVTFPGIYYRGRAEQKIRRYLIDNNYVESIIALAPNLFFGTPIATNILVLSKHKTDTRTQFIDASSFFKKETNNNTLTDEHIAHILQLFIDKTDVPHLAQSVDYQSIVDNDYNLAVNTYVQAKDTREVIDIDALNADIRDTVANIDRLRTQIDAIVAEIEGEMNILQMIDTAQVQWKALGEVGTLIRGNGLQKKDFTETGVPAIHYGQIYTYYGLSTTETISFVSPELAKKLRKVNTGDVVITNTSENLKDVGKALVYLGKEQAVTGGHATIFRPSAEIMGKFFAYFTQTALFAREKKKYAKGTKVIDVSATDLAKIQIPLPPLEMQKNIVKVLDKFTELEATLEAELHLRTQQYAYYREKLLHFTQSPRSPV